MRRHRGEEESSDEEEISGGGEKEGNGEDHHPAPEPHRARSLTAEAHDGSATLKLLHAITDLCPELQ